MAALLATSLLATACPRPDAQPAVLATSAIFVNNTPSAANYLAAVTLPPAAWSEQTQFKNGSMAPSGPTPCNVKPLGQMHTILCLFHAYDPSASHLYSLCRSELSPRSPCSARASCRPT